MSGETKGAPNDGKEGANPDFRPEGAEIEPAGGIIKKPPTPTTVDDPPTEGDKR
jgi:hypothetical protein